MANSPEQYFMSFKDKTAELHAMDMRLIRKFTMKSKVVNAVVSGAGKDANIAITVQDGKTYLYKSDGRMVRCV